MASKIAALLVVMMMTWAPSPADACSCRPPVPACQGTWEHEAVFVGQVRQSVRAGDRDVVDFDVLEAFRGVAPGHATLSTLFGTCTFAFTKGRTYLVYAHRDGRNLATSTCSGTKAVEVAGDDLTYLRALATMKPRATGDVRGRVHAPDGRGGWVPLAGVEVRFTGSAGTRAARTDAKGSVSVTGVPDTYVVHVDAAPGYIETSGGSSVTLRDARGCVVADVFLSRLPPTPPQ